MYTYIDEERRESDDEDEGLTSKKDVARGFAAETKARSILRQKLNQTIWKELRVFSEIELG